jgi:hypothetical protein
VGISIEQIDRFRLRDFGTSKADCEVDSHASAPTSKDAPPRKHQR